MLVDKLQDVTCSIALNEDTLVIGNYLMEELKE